MSKPKIFISSTYYDLKHIRSSLDLFIDSLGFEPILSEKGDIAYTHEAPLDKSCYREVDNADIFVLIIGGRYGSEASANKAKMTKAFFDQYDSVTKKEFERAIEKDIQTYILVEKDVYSEFQTYLKNKGNKKTIYAHVDSVNIFELIEEIKKKNRNNALHTFERFSDIEEWLREQWAGLFKILLDRKSEDKQISDLASQIDDLKGVNNTLKTYLEAVMKSTEVEDSEKLIEDEERRVEKQKIREKILEIGLVEFLIEDCNLSIEDFISISEESKSLDDFAKRVDSLPQITRVAELFSAHHEKATNDINIARKILGLEPFEIPEDKPPRKAATKKPKKKD